MGHLGHQVGPDELDSPDHQGLIKKMLHMEASWNPTVEGCLTLQF